MPQEQAFFRRLLALQDDAEVAYTSLISISVDPPEVNAAFRAGSLRAGRSYLTHSRKPRRSSGSARRPTP